MTGFTYWIGMFFPAETIVPNGYNYLDLPESNIGVDWVYGKLENGEIYGGPPHEAVCKNYKMPILVNSAMTLPVGAVILIAFLNATIVCVSPKKTQTAT